MSQTLRPYQHAAVDATLAALDRDPVLVAPTGSGKTTMAVEIVTRLHRPTLWLAHRAELIEQAAHRLEDFGLAVGIIKAGMAPFPLAPVQVASVQTLVRRIPPRAELIVIDECHHAAADTYGKILEQYPSVPTVGLTATPFRLDGRGLGDIFGTIITAAAVAELVEQQYLHAPKIWATKAPDLRGVKVTAGDYNRRQLAERTNTADMRADIVAQWQAHAADRRTVAFAVDRQHSRDIVAAFQEAGVPAEHVDGATPADERTAILGRLRTGETHVVSNCMILTEGWDLPALECAILARPTASLCLHLQQVGRVMRACADKDGAIVLDHAGNHYAHGLVTRPIQYSLDPDTKAGHTEGLGLRRCAACALLYPLSTRECPDCGHVNAPNERARPEIHGPGQLAPLDDWTYKTALWNSIEAERQAMEYKPGWSYFRYIETTGERPLVIAGELVNPVKATQEQKATQYRRLLAQARAKQYRDGWAAHQFRDVFGTWPRGFVAQVRRDIDRAALRDRFRQAALAAGPPTYTGTRV